MEIDGYGGNYLIFPNGLVFSKYKMIFLKTNICNQGYKYIKLFIKTKAKTYKIHRLIAQYFIPNPNNYPVVDHIDRNKLNNDITNLRWVTVRENARNVSQRKSKSGYTGIIITYSKTYQAFMRISKAFLTIEEAIQHRNRVYNDILKRKPRNELTGVSKTKYNRYESKVTITKTYKTLQEAIEYRKQLELKYHN